MTKPAEYPLTWPDNMPRAGRKATSLFKTSLNGTLKNVRDSLRRFSEDSGRKLDNVIISSNYTLGVTNPADPGVAVWFVWDGRQVCIAVDRYPKLQDNVQAIHHILEARRTELRHGGLNIVKATFTGFQALPAPNGAKMRTWRQVMDFSDGEIVDKSRVEARHKALSKKRHPDTPTGSKEAMSELNIARQDALAELENLR
ncbi:J domain-containing protein [Hoeflea poritis]|uniref:J domain-containing protein n=1 Tax=Hoeflea poritis TaxID=2993659 RepID=A0ABT4VMP6_9HYPH|nr:J domain-containing protein [Hoeflea poritis]MDA4845989.1 J domain-containing protein [Hoeflea poritis]